MIAALLGLIVAAAPAEEPDPLTSIRALLREGRLDEGASAARALREEGALLPPTLARSYLLEGMARALLDDDDGAAAAFDRAVCIDPTVDPEVKQPIVRTPFEAARARAAHPCLDARLTALSEEEAATPGLEVRLVVDAFGLVAAARASVSAAEVSLSKQAPLAFLAEEGPPLLLVDEHGNVLAVLGDAARDPHAATATGPGLEKDVDKNRFALAEYPWGTIAGASVIATGLVVAVCSGALVAAHDRGLLLPEPAAPFARPIFLAGVGVGAVVIAAGAAGVLTDQVLFRGALEGPAAEAPPAPTPEAPAEAPADAPAEGKPEHGGPTKDEPAPPRPAGPG